MSAAVGCLDLFLTWGLAWFNGVATRPAIERVQTITIEAGDLRAVFRDNSESPRVLSGVGSLINLRDAPGFDAFDPDSPGASAGLNFEHIIAGQQDPHNAFAPRHGRYDLCRLPDGRSVMLVRDAADDPWAVASTMKYTLTPPHYIDLEFKCRVDDAKRFGKHRYAIFFWANYMNDVADVALHFRGLERPGGEETWIAADAPPGHPDWNKGGTYRAERAADLPSEADLTFRLNSWSYDFPRFTRPFYYGRLANDMVYMLMFDRAYTPDDEVRFSLFKFKLDRFPRPAWDFQYVIRDVREGHDYGYRARVVFKRFVSPADCLREYETWTQSLVPPSMRPASAPASTSH